MALYRAFIMYDTVLYSKSAFKELSKVGMVIALAYETK